MNNQKVLVTGAAGFIGSHLTEKLLCQGKTVVGIDNFHPYYSKRIKENNLFQIRQVARNKTGTFNFIEGSILSTKTLKGLSKCFDIIYHNAAIAGARNSVNNPLEYSKINIIGTLNLLNYVKYKDKFVFTSSSSVYGEKQLQQLPIKEKQSLNPKNPYAVSKKQAEYIIKQYSELLNKDYVIVRPFTVYGPRQRPDEVFTKFINRALKDELIEIYGDGEQTRDFTYVKDVIDGMISAGQHGSGIYNLGSQERTSVNKLVQLIRNETEKELNISYIEEKEADVKHTHADISKAAKELDYSPQTSIESGLEECLNWVSKMNSKNLLN